MRTVPASPFARLSPTLVATMMLTAVAERLQVQPEECHFWATHAGMHPDANDKAWLHRLYEDRKTGIKIYFP